MEFPDLGQHCFLDTCKQLDFLPFTCDACQKIYCKDHVKYDNHSCLAGQSKDKRVPVCPLCQQPISLSATESVDQKVNDHIENDCKSDLAQHKRSNRCKKKGCKERQLVPILCSSCKQNFCLRHRHESDHNCSFSSSSSNSRSRSQNQAASSRAGQAALERLQKNISPRPSQQRAPRSQNTSNRPTQQRPVSFNRNNTNASSYRSHHMSEDEALQMALQASLAESSFKPPPENKQLTQQEIEDIQLAKAIEESEIEERERQRRGNSEGSNKDKDTCLIS